MILHVIIHEYSYKFQLFSIGLLYGKILFYHANKHTIMIRRCSLPLLFRQTYHCNKLPHIFWILKRLIWKPRGKIPPYIFVLCNQLNPLSTSSVVIEIILKNNQYILFVIAETVLLRLILLKTAIAITKYILEIMNKNILILFSYCVNILILK